MQPIIYKKQWFSLTINLETKKRIKIQNQSSLSHLYLSSDFHDMNLIGAMTLKSVIIIVLQLVTKLS